MAEYEYNLGEYAVKGGPGRPKGSRRKALDYLDQLFDENPHEKLFKEAKIETTGIIDPEVLREIFLNNVEYRAGQSPTDAAEADRFDADTGELPE